MAVARMKKVTIIASQDLKEDIFERLRDLGTMQVTAETIRAERIPDEAISEELSKRISELAYVKAYLEKYNPIKKSFIDGFTGKKPEYSLKALLEDAVKSFDIDAAVATVREHEALFKSIDDETAAIMSEMESLEPWRALDIPLESLGQSTLSESLLATVPLSSLGELDSSVLGQPVHYEKVWEARNLAGVWMAGLLDTPVRIPDLVAAAKGNVVQLKTSRPGTPGEILEALAARLVELESRKAELLREANEMSANLYSVMALIDYYLDKKNLGELSSKVGQTKFTLVVEGWVKAKDAQALESAFSGMQLVETVVEDPTGEDDPPVYLENHPIIWPFEIITNIFGFPKYNEIDPTPFLAPFFWLFFGLCLGDAVYGIVLFVGAWVFLKTQKLPPGSDKLIKLMQYCGLSTVLAGALTNSWMADLASAFAPNSGLAKALASIALLDPLNDPLTMMVLSFGFGIFHVWVGIGVKMLSYFRQGDVKEGILSCGSWMVFLPGLILWAISKAGMLQSNIPLYIMAAGALMVMYSASRSQKNILLKPFSGLYGLYGVVGYFSDTMSYSRLLALGLASAIIGVVVNKIASLIATMIPVVGWAFVPVVLLVGHIFNLVINVLGSFIHAGRLQFVEFFTKFFEGGGKPFRPLKRVSEHVSFND